MKLQIAVFSVVILVQLAVCPLAYTQGQSASAAATAQPTPVAQIKDWFNKYDEIRRGAQMNPTERQKADTMLSKGLSMFVPGPEKLETQQLLQKLEVKNNAAAEQMKKLNLYPETEQLHRGYFKFFTDSQILFADYLKVQDNLMAKDAANQPIAAQLMRRKKELEELDFANKALDSQLRTRFGIAPYKY
jgi:hypothetical protein